MIDLSSCSIMLVILLLTGFGTNLANAKEQVLTSGMETTLPDYPLDEHGHEIYARRVNVSYNREDSCFQKPAQPYIMSHSILVQLDNTGFNTGFGTIICYVGQLDPLNQELGIQPTPPYFVRNRKNNSIDNACQKAREKLPKDKFTGQTWHGFQLRQKEENSNILVLTLSSSNHNFEIPRSFFKDGRLFIKLTRWNSNVAHITNTIGPGFNGMLIKQQKERRMNDTLLNDYMSKVGQGANMDKFAGPWTLGVDILSRWNGSNPLEEIINFYVLRSNCSELAVSFLRPSDVAITNTNTPRMVRSNPASEVVKLTIGFIIEIRARVHDNPTNFTVRMTTREEKSEYLGRGLLMEFDDEHDVTIPVFQFYNISIPDWIRMDSVAPIDGSNTSLTFRAGQLFILKIVSLESTFKMGVNCGSFVTYSHTANIAAITSIKIEVDGDVDVYNISKQDSRPQRRKGIIRERSEGWALDSNRGYLLRGTNLTNTDEWAINVTFMYASGDTNKLLFEFVARRSAVEAKVFVKIGTNTTDYDISLLEEFTQGTFELHFILNTMIFDKKARIFEFLEDNTIPSSTIGELGMPQREVELGMPEREEELGMPEREEIIVVKNTSTFELLLNDVKIGIIELPNMVQVEVIKIIADVEAIKDYITFITPLLFDKPDQFSNTDTYSIVGKVPINGREFAINFLYHNHKKAHTRTPGECQSVLEIKMVNETTTFSSIYETGNQKELEITNATSLSFLQGYDFQMMVTSSRDNKGKIHDFTIDVMITSSEDAFHLEQKYILPEKADFSLRPNHILITGDIILFNEPDVYGSVSPIPVALGQKEPEKSDHSPHMKSLASNNVTGVEEDYDKLNGTSAGMNGTNF